MSPMVEKIKTFCLSKNLKNLSRNQRTSHKPYYNFYSPKIKIIHSDFPQSPFRFAPLLRKKKAESEKQKQMAHNRKINTRAHKPSSLIPVFFCLLFSSFVFIIPSPSSSPPPPPPPLVLYYSVICSDILHVFQEFSPNTFDDKKRKKRNHDETKPKQKNLCSLYII
jgi:hypothetical protein